MSGKKIGVYVGLFTALCIVLLFLVMDIGQNEEYHYQLDALELDMKNSSCTLAIRDILMIYDYCLDGTRPERPATFDLRVNGKSYDEAAQWFRIAIERADIYLSSIYDGQTTAQPVIREMKEYIDAHTDMDLDAMMAFLGEYEPALRDALVVTRRDEKYDDYDLKRA